MRFIAHPIFAMLVNARIAPFIPPGNITIGRGNRERLSNCNYQ